MNEFLLGRDLGQQMNGNNTFASSWTTLNDEHLLVPFSGLFG